MSSTADVVRIDATGRVRLADGSIDAVIRAGAVFCTTAKGCGPCPDGQRPSFAASPLAASSLLAASGGTDGASGTVSGHRLEEFCRATPRPSPSQPSEFCRRWHLYLDWATEHKGIDMDRTTATTIVMLFQAMHPAAPPDLEPHVSAVIRAYTSYAALPNPIQVPVTGRDAFAMYQGLKAIDAHCGTAAIP